MSRPLRLPSRFAKVAPDLPWSLDALADTATGLVRLVVTNGPPRDGAKRLRRFESADSAERARRLMVASARPGARLVLA